MEITSINNSLIKETVKLHQKKYRDKLNLFLIEGYHLYEEAQKKAIIKHGFTIDKTLVGNNVHYVTLPILKKLAKTVSSVKIVCVCHKLAPTKVTNKVLILDHVQDPGNLGTLLRSALAFGFKTIILDNTVDLYNDKVIRSTQGAMFYLNVVEMKTLDFINHHQDHTIYGTSMKGDSLNDVKPATKMALILGNEGQGLSKEVLDKVNYNITIKMKDVESLNVGVAGSIIMHYINNN